MQQSDENNPMSLTYPVARNSVVHTESKPALWHDDTITDKSEDMLMSNVQLHYVKQNFGPISFHCGRGYASLHH